MTNAPRRWSVRPNGGVLEPGVYLRVCADYDAAGEQFYRDSGLEVYICPVSAVGAVTVDGTQASVSVTCPRCVPEVTRAYLARPQEGCFRHIHSGQVPSGWAKFSAAATYDGNGFAFNIAPLAAEVDYHLCVDVDGALSDLSFGDAGVVVPLD